MIDLPSVQVGRLCHPAASYNRVRGRRFLGTRPIGHNPGCESAQLRNLERRLAHLHGVNSVDESADGFWINVSDMDAVSRDDVFGAITDKSHRVKTTLSGKPVYKVRRRDTSTIGALEDALKVELEKLPAPASQNTIG